jgi:hypothetical protein
MDGTEHLNTQPYVGLQEHQLPQGLPAHMAQHGLHAEHGAA